MVAFFTRNIENILWGTLKWLNRDFPLWYNVLATGGMKYIRKMRCGASWNEGREKVRYIKKAI